MLCIVILSFILSLMFFKLKQLESCGFAQLDWLLVTISVNTISTVINFDLSGFHEAYVGKKTGMQMYEFKIFKTWNSVQLSAEELSEDRQKFVTI